MSSTLSLTQQSHTVTVKSSELASKQSSAAHANDPHHSGDHSQKMSLPKPPSFSASADVIPRIEEPAIPWPSSGETKQSGTSSVSSSNSPLVSSNGRKTSGPHGKHKHRTREESNASAKDSIMFSSSIMEESSKVVTRKDSLAASIAASSIREKEVSVSAEMSVAIPSEFMDAILIKVAQQHIADLEASVSNSNAGPTKCIYDYTTKEDLLLLNPDLISKLNMIFMSEKQALIPDSFLTEYHEDMFGEAPKEKWFSFLFHPRRAPKKLLENDLATICRIASTAVDGRPSYFKVPILLKTCADEARKKAGTVGIFRISGNAKRINDLLDRFNAPPDYGAGYSFAGYNVFDCADTIKRLFKNLEEPIFPELLFPYIMTAAKIEEQYERVRASQIIVMLLPKNSSMALSYLLEFLHEISQRHNDNQMTDVNLATVFSPSLIRAADPQELARGSAHAIKFLSTMIRNAQLFQMEKLNVMAILNPPEIPEKKRRRRKSVLKKQSTMDLHKDETGSIAEEEIRTSATGTGSGRRKSVVFNQMMDEVQMIPGRIEITAPPEPDSTYQ